MTLYVGIDPGLGGGIAILGPEEPQVFATPVTDGSKREYMEHVMASILAGAGRDVRAQIEAQQYRPKQAARSTFQTGLGFGIWRGILSAYGIPYEIVQPSKWRRAVGLPDGSDKAASSALACRLFPSLADELVGPRGGIKDGPSEALLIAEALRRSA